MNPLQTEARIVAQHLGLADRVDFSDRLQWIGRDGELQLLCFRVDPNSGQVTVFPQALEAAFGDDASRQLPEGLRWCRDFDEGKHPRDESGRWTDGGGGGDEDAAVAADSAKQPSASDFIAARNRSSRAQFLSPLQPSDLSQHKLVMNDDGTAGVAIDPRGDLQNLFNNGGGKGAAAQMVVAAVAKGAKTLDCYDGFLPSYYSQFGFRETGRMKFNPEFAHDWDVEKYGQPDVVFMAFSGYPKGGAEAAIARAGSKTEWLPHERSSTYESDWDRAKEQSRSQSRRARGYLCRREEPGARVERAGSLAGDRASQGHRRALGTDLDSRTLYVCRPLENADELLAWAQQQGIPNTMDPSELHVTIAFSKRPVDWNGFEPATEPLVVTPTRTSVAFLGNDGALVLKFESVELQSRWREFIQGGASWDWPEYQPHVTLSYDASELDKSDLSLMQRHVSLLQRYDGQLVFGPERFAEIDPNWKKEWDESEHPRDEDGKFTFGGGGSDEEAIPVADEASAAAQATPSGTDVGATSGKAKTKVSDFKGKVKLSDDEPHRTEKFLEDFDRRYDGTPDDFRRSFTGRDDNDMTFQHGVGGVWYVTGAIRNDEGHSIGSYTRKIDFSTKRAESQYFAIADRSARASGIGKAMLAGNVAMYQKLGIEKVDVHANIDVGGYAWAKYGYVPSRDSWRDLSQQLERKLGGGSRVTSSDDGDGYTPESWDQVGDSDRDAIRDAWMRATRDEFIESEENSWRENGDAERDALGRVVEGFNSDGHDQWARDALSERYTFRGEEPDEDKIALPFSQNEVIDAISLQQDDESRANGWKGAVSVQGFSNEKLDDANPTGYDELQPTLPGIQHLRPHDYLTEKMREDITEIIESAASDQVDKVASSMDPPDYLADNITESQESYWDDAVDDDYRYNWAERNGQLPSYPIESDDDEESSPPVEVSDSEESALFKLVRSSDPRSVWAIADSPKGKELLLNTDWYGTLDLKDKQSMDRFNAYVSKTPSKKAA